MAQYISSLQLGQFLQQLKSSAVNMFDSGSYHHSLSLTVSPPLTLHVEICTLIGSKVQICNVQCPCNFLI